MTIEELGTTFVILPTEKYVELFNKIEEIEKLVKGKAKEEADSSWIESSEARKMLGVSAKTWQTYRDNRVIPFSQFGRKIYVRRRDLEAFLLSHTKK